MELYKHGEEWLTDIILICVNSIKDHKANKGGNNTNDEFTNKDENFSNTSSNSKQESILYDDKESILAGNTEILTRN